MSKCDCDRAVYKIDISTYGHLYVVSKRCFNGGIFGRAKYWSEVDTFGSIDNAKAFISMRQSLPLYFDKDGKEL